MPVLEINGVDVSELVSISYSINQIISPESGRDMAGIDNTDIIAEKIIIDCTCSMLTLSQSSTLLKAFDIKAVGGVRCDVEYPDLKKGFVRTTEFKVTNQSSSNIVDVSGVTYCLDFSFSLEEI